MLHDTTPTKRCSKCGEIKPATSEYFNYNKKTPDRLRYECKDCQHAIGRRYYEANKKKLSQKYRAWRSANKELKKQLDHAYYEANKERCLQKARSWAAANKERVRNMRRAWAASNREAVRAKVNRRRIRKLNAEGKHTVADVKVQYERQKGKCYWCDKKLGENYHVDHVVPLSRGGSDWPENIVCACPRCNLSKKDKLPHEWPEGGRLI